MEISSMIPDDVLEDILLRLPVKHLLQFKCVCKQWYALIGDYDFHKKHYHLQYAMHVAEHDNVPLFLDNPPLFRQKFVPTQFYLLSKQQDADVVLNVTPDFDRDIPPAFANDPELCNLALQCMGVVNGVIGLQWGTRFFSWDRSRLALWNPATREFKGIPRWTAVSGKEASRVTGARILGLGFDLQSADFKILVLISFQSNDDTNSTFSECHLYSLKSNSWKRIKETPNSFVTINYSLIDAQLSNGVYYWLALESDVFESHGIVSFNFSTEVCKEFALPEGVRCCNTQQVGSDGRVSCHCFHVYKVGKYKDSLALFVGTDPKEADVKFEMWVVTKFRDDDNEVPLSWQLRLTVGPIQSSFSRLWLRTFRICGDLLLSIEHESPSDKAVRCIYDPSTCTFKFLGIQFYSSFSYVESLFSLSVLN